jgi:hypothetical protein
MDEKGNLYASLDHDVGRFHHSTLTDGPAPYAEAIPPALAYDGPLNDEIEIDYSEAEIRAFLAMLAQKLDELRPWPGTAAG